MKIPVCAVAILLIGITAPLRGGVISIMIGDDDGYGYGAAVVPNNGNFPLTNDLAFADRRDAVEMLATNGAQQTDIYTALQNAFPTSFDVIFPLSGLKIVSATLVIDMGGFQPSTYGQIGAAFNGVGQPDFLNFDDGQFPTVVRSFVLGAAPLANANAAGQFVLTLSRGNSQDAIGFDFFRLDAVVEDVPEPGTWLTIAVGLAACALFSSRSHSRRV